MLVYKCTLKYSQKEISEIKEAAFWLGKLNTLKAVNNLREKFFRFMPNNPAMILIILRLETYYFILFGGRFLHLKITNWKFYNFSFVFFLKPLLGNVAITLQNFKFMFITETAYSIIFRKIYTLSHPKNEGKLISRKI